jgi:hypothetical protein
MTGPHGTCPHCLEQFRLRNDGRLRHHTGRGRRVLPSGTWAHCCEGCAQLPLEAVPTP